MVRGDKIPPGIMFSLISKDESLNGYKEDPYEKLTNRRWGDLQPISHEHLHNILTKWDSTDEPPPKELILPLFYDLDLAMRGYPSALFRSPKGVNKPSKHLMAEWMERNAVLYVLCCQEYGWDEAPIKTIAEICDVHPSSVYRWVKKYAYDEEGFVYEDLKDDFQETLEALNKYKDYKHK